MRVLVLLFAVGIILTLLQGTFGEDAFLAAVSLTLLELLGSALFTLAGLGTLFEMWRKKRWRVRTAWVAVDVLDQAMRQVALIARSVLAAGPPDESQRSLLAEIDGSFQLPFSPTRVKTVDDVKGALAPDVERFFAQPSDDRKHQASGTAQPATVAADLEDRADRLWSMAVELHGAVGGKAAELLLESVARFARTARQLADAFVVHLDGPPVVDLLRIIGYSQLLDSSVVVACHLDDVLADVRKMHLPPKLERELKNRERSLQEADRSKEEIWRHERAVNELVKDTDDILAEMGRGFEELEVAVRNFSYGATTVSGPEPEHRPEPSR